MSRSNNNQTRGRGGPRGTTRSRGGGQGRPQPPGQDFAQTRRGGWVPSREISTGRTPSAFPTTSSSESSSQMTGAGNPAALRRWQMELMPSVSRSSGLDKDGDSLKNYAVQEEYRHFIEEKVEKVLKRHENLDSETEDTRKHRIEEQENVLILFRKLREGISSSGRVDSFSIEVYERSLYLSILFTSRKHTMVIIPALLDDLYIKAYSPPTSPLSGSTSHSHHRHVSLLISLVNHLVTQYPSQNLYHQQHASLPKNWILSSTSGWLQSLTRSLHSGNYYQLGILINEKHVMALLRPPKHPDTSKIDAYTQLHDNLALQALKTTIDALRSKGGASTWKIMRSAYRELWFEEAYDTRHWLRVSLDMESPEKFDQWLVEAENLNELRRKGGTTEGRWIVTKVR